MGEQNWVKNSGFSQNNDQHQHQKSQNQQNKAKGYKDKAKHKLSDSKRPFYRVLVHKKDVETMMGIGKKQNKALRKNFPLPPSEPFMDLQDIQNDDAYDDETSFSHMVDDEELNNQ